MLFRSVWKIYLHSFQMHLLHHRDLDRDLVRDHQDLRQVIHQMVNLVNDMDLVM